MFDRKEYNSPSWLNQIDRIIFNLLRPVFNLSFGVDGRFPYYPSHFKEEDDIGLPGWDEGGDSAFLYESSDGTSEFRIHNINEKYAKYRNGRFAYLESFRFQLNIVLVLEHT